MKTVGTKLDNSEYEIFEFCCNENGLSKSEQLRVLIKNFVNNETKQSSNKKEKSNSSKSKPLKYVKIPKLQIKLLE